MLSTGIRTPIGIKVFGKDLNEMERLAKQIEAVVKTVPGTSSTFAERITGGFYLNIEPDRMQLAHGRRHGAAQCCPDAASAGVIRKCLNRLPYSYFPSHSRTHCTMYATPLSMHFKARQIHHLMQSRRESVTEHTASVRILGLSLEQLGLGVARAWGLPANIQRCMCKPEGSPPSRTPKEKEERMRWLALAANEIADVLLQYAPGEIQARIILVTRKYAQTMATASSDLLDRTVRGRQKLIEMATAMDIQVAHGSMAARLLTPPDRGSPQTPVNAAMAEERSGTAKGSTRPLFCSCHCK